MWIKFIENTEFNRKNEVVSVGDIEGQSHINDGYAIRCLGPDGKIFEESTPEDIITQLAKEDGVTFEEEEKHLQLSYKKLKKENRKKADLGTYVPNEILDKTKLKKGGEK